MATSAAAARRSGPAGRCTFEEVCAEALFASTLQASDSPTPDRVRDTIAAILRRRGITGCAAVLAAEFGDHPDLAAARMSWALATVRTAFATRRAVPALVRRPLALAS